MIYQLKGPALPMENLRGKIHECPQKLSVQSVQPFGRLQANIRMSSFIKQIIDNIIDMSVSCDQNFNQQCIIIVMCLSMYHVTMILNWEMDTPQHGNRSKITFGEFPFFRNSRKSHKSSELLRDFRILCIRFLIFIVKCFPLFLGWFLHIFRSVSSYF